MIPALDFGPQMLALFLQAHVVHAGNMAAMGYKVPAIRARKRKAGEEAERRRIAADAIVSLKVFDLAMRGSVIVHDRHRQSLWRALGIDPDIHHRRAA